MRNVANVTGQVEVQPTYPKNTSIVSTWTSAKKGVVICFSWSTWLLKKPVRPNKGNDGISPKLISVKQIPAKILVLDINNFYLEPTKESIGMRE